MIDSYRLAKLLRARIVFNNKRKRIRKVTVKTVAVYKNLIEFYFGICFAKAVKSGDAIPMPFLGNLQVIEKPAKKGWRWDKKFDGKDYELVLDTKKNVSIKINKAWYPKVINAVGRGVTYKSEVINYEERLDEILSLLDAEDKPRATEQRSAQATAE